MPSYGYAGVQGGVPRRAATFLRAPVPYRVGARATDAGSLLAPFARRPRLRKARREPRAAGGQAGPVRAGARAVTAACVLCRRRQGQQAAGGARPAGPSLAGVASRFADYAVSVLEGATHDGGGAGTVSPQQTPATAPRRSALDALRWNARAPVGGVARRAKRQKTDDKSQLYLDFGQRNFYQTKCTVCDMCYCPGLASDEKLHEDFHKRVTHGILYKGFKNQHAVQTFPDGSYIVCVRRTDPAAHRTKADEVRQMAERELGGFGGAHDESVVMFLMISPERRAVGFLLAEPIRRAYRVVIAAPAEHAHRPALSDVPEPGGVAAEGTAHVLVVSPQRSPSQGSEAGRAPAPAGTPLRPAEPQEHRDDNRQDGDRSRGGAVAGGDLAQDESHDPQASSRGDAAKQGEAGHAQQDSPAADQAPAAAAARNPPPDETDGGFEARMRSADAGASDEHVRGSCDAMAPAARCLATPGAHTAGDTTIKCPQANPKTETETGAVLSHNSDDDDDDLSGLDLCALEAAALEGCAPGGGGQAAAQRASGDGSDDDDDDLDLDAIEAAALAAPSGAVAAAQSSEGVGASESARASGSDTGQAGAKGEQKQETARMAPPLSSEPALVHGVGTPVEQDVGSNGRVLGTGGAGAEHAEPWQGEDDNVHGVGSAASGSRGGASPATGCRDCADGGAGEAVVARAASACATQEVGQLGGGAAEEGGAQVLAGDAGAYALRHGDKVPLEETAGDNGGEGGGGVEGNREEEDSWADSLLVSTEEEPAICGVRLVWVHRSHRRRGVATSLLRAALQHSGLNHGFAVPPSRCAFSQVCSVCLCLCVCVCVCVESSRRSGLRV